MGKDTLKTIALMMIAFFVIQMLTILCLEFRVLNHIQMSVIDFILTSIVVIVAFRLAKTPKK
jgi:hypothetical protein